MLLLYGNEVTGFSARPYHLPLGQSSCLDYAVTEPIPLIVLPTVPHFNR